MRIYPLRRSHGQALVRRCGGRIGLAQLIPLLIIAGIAIGGSLYLWTVSKIFSEQKMDERASDICGLVMQQEAALVVEYAFVREGSLNVFVSNPGDIDLVVTSVGVPPSPLVFSPNAQTVCVGEGLWLDPTRYPAMQGAMSSDLVQVFALPLPLYDSSDPSLNSQYHTIAYWPSTTRIGGP